MVETDDMWNLQKAPVGKLQYSTLEFRNKFLPSKKIITHSLIKILSMSLGPVKIMHVTIRNQVKVCLELTITKDMLFIHQGVNSVGQNSITL